MKTEELVARLQAAYPGREIQVVAKSDTAYLEDDSMPEQLVGIVHEDFLIIDPYTTECGRFACSPSGYGIEEGDALAMCQHNGVVAPAELARQAEQGPEDSFNPSPAG